VYVYLHVYVTREVENQTACKIPPYLEI